MTADPGVLAAAAVVWILVAGTFLAILVGILLASLQARKAAQRAVSLLEAWTARPPWERPPERP